jgi:hypothetical protein
MNSKKTLILQHEPDDIAWLPESRMLALCELSRSAFTSWKKAGINLESEDGAYGLGEIIPILLLVAARSHMLPKEMAGAWREIEASDKLARIIHAARGLEPGERFDLVVAPEHAVLNVALDERELVEAVRNPGAPVPVVVLDLADRVRMVVGTFNRIANRTGPPSERSPGRPRSADRSNVRALRDTGSS